MKTENLTSSHMYVIINRLQHTTEEFYIFPTHFPGTLLQMVARCSSMCLQSSYFGERNPQQCGFDTSQEYKSLNR